MAYVDLEDMPSAKKEYVFSFPSLTGGMNVRELDYRLDSNESPKMQNLMWKDGVLCSRDGQAWVNHGSNNGTGHTAYQYTWHDRVFAHVGTKLLCYKTNGGTQTVLFTGGSDFTVRGTFFMYNGKLYYKTKGYYVEITATASESDYSFTIRSIDSTNAYTPVTYINCSPTNGSGDAYQPENRLSNNKTLWYNAEHKVTVASSSASLTPEIVEVTWLVKFPKSGTYVFTYNGTAWTFGGVEVLLSDYGMSCSGTPVVNDTITVNSVATDTYYLPVKGSDVDLLSVKVDGVEKEREEYDISYTGGIESVTVDHITWSSLFTTDVVKTFEYWLTEDYWTLDGVQVSLSTYGITYTGTPENLATIEVDYTYGDYSFDQATGKVKFRTAPPVTVPATNNTVVMTYSMTNTTAYNNIMDCRYVSTYGGVSNDLCIIMAGSTTQVNAYFWNGQTSVDMDATYFPMTQYQIAGDLHNPITGFGKQQSYLIIFSDRSIGRTLIDTEEIDDRTTIDLPYTAINDKIGCNLPWTIQLVENNLVWANTEQGIHFLANTSSAYENNVVCISSKVNGTGARMALLYDIRKDEADNICSLDTDHRYWVVANNHAWLWDYADDLSNYKDPSWFYYTNIDARALIMEPESRSLTIENIWHVDSEGNLTKFENTFSDYGEGIEKIYRFATQYFSTYDTYKNINSIIITVRSDTPSTTKLKYMTDYEDRYDLEPLEITTWRLVPRDLSRRDLSASRFAKRFRRKPMCRRVAHFTMELYNNTTRQDMSIVTAQIFYNFQGRQR